MSTRPLAKIGHHDVNVREGGLIKIGGTTPSNQYKCKTDHFHSKHGADPPTRMRVAPPSSFTFSPSKNYGFYTAIRHSRPPMTNQVPDDREEIDLGDETDRWRYTCPHGHREWEPTNHHFWCAGCARSPRKEAVFQTLRDASTGLEYRREEVRLVDHGGPYDRDLDREGGAAADD